MRAGVRPEKRHRRPALFELAGVYAPSASCCGIAEPKKASRVGGPLQLPWIHSVQPESPQRSLAPNKEQTNANKENHNQTDQEHELSSFA